MNLWISGSNAVFLLINKAPEYVNTKFHVGVRRGNGSFNHICFPCDKEESRSWINIELLDCLTTKILVKTTITVSSDPTCKVPAKLKINQLVTRTWNMKILSDELKLVGHQVLGKPTTRMLSIHSHDFFELCLRVYNYNKHPRLCKLVFSSLDVITW